MARWQALFGRLVLEITCADMAALINTVNSEGIRLLDVTYCNDLVIQLTIMEQDRRKLLQIVQKQGASAKEIKRFGTYWVAGAVLKRPVLIIFFCIMLIFAIYLPSRVLFISVEGNSAVPTNRILEAASESGLHFGVSRRQVRSEVMKNALLQKIPQLQWAGVNTSGCTAVISVKEKTETDKKSDTENQVCSIIAARDGVIQNCTVYQGNPLCTVGQAVKAGQTLVSGYLDCGILTKATRASAEIKALTFRQLELITPVAIESRGELYTQKTSYSLQLGKKLIKITKDSGNLDTSCAKIYTEEYLCLPGGFQLPIAVIKETQLFYRDGEQTAATSDSENWLADFAQAYLQDTMIAGEVISAEIDLTSGDDVVCLSGRYACMEMIGQIKYEQTILRDEANE